jgi:hypothetical protein
MAAVAVYPTAAAAAPAERRILVAGQSLAKLWEKYPSAQQAFVDSRASMGDTTPTRFSFAAFGGSSALRDLCNSDPANWWVDYRPGSSITAGPRLQQAREIIKAMPAAERPNEIFWIEGTTAAVIYATGRIPWSEEEFKRRYAVAAAATIINLQRACCPTNPNSVRVHVQRLGPIPRLARPADVLVMEAQDAMVEQRAAYNFRTGAVHTADIPRPAGDRVHPTEAGTIILANRFAKAYANAAGDNNGGW